MYLDDVCVNKLDSVCLNGRGGPRKTFPEVVSGSVCMLKTPYIYINVGTVELQKSFKYVTLWNSMYIMMTVVMTLKISRTSVTSVDIGTVSDAAQPYFAPRPSVREEAAAALGNLVFFNDETNAGNQVSQIQPACRIQISRLG